MTADDKCPYCFSPLQKSPLYWWFCNKHLPVELLFTPYNGAIKTCMYIPNDDKMYSLYWEDAKSLLVYEHMKEAPIMHANIPIINPDQATSLLRRLLTNVSFS